METIGRISLFVVMLLFCVPALGAEYFLSPEGNDESPGTRPPVAEHRARE